MLLFIPVTLVRTAFLFVARAAIMGAFSVTYLYTPELYPTRFRATAFGIANSFARVGGMVCPFVGQALVEEGYLAESFIIFALLCFVATVAAFNVRACSAWRRRSSPSRANISFRPRSCRWRPLERHSPKLWATASRHMRWRKCNRSPKDSPASTKRRKGSRRTPSPRTFQVVTPR